MEERKVLDGLLKMPLYRYRLKQTNSTLAEQLGVLAEEAPAELVDGRQQAITCSDYLAAIVAAVKTQQAEIESLRADISNLES